MTPDNIDPVIGWPLAALLWGLLAWRNRASIKATLISFFRDYLGFTKRQEPSDDAHL